MNNQYRRYRRSEAYKVKRRRKARLNGDYLGFHGYTGNDPVVISRERVMNRSKIEDIGSFMARTIGEAVKADPTLAEHANDTSLINYGGVWMSGADYMKLNNMKP